MFGFGFFFGLIVVIIDVLVSGLVRGSLEDRIFVFDEVGSFGGGF